MTSVIVKKYFQTVQCLLGTWRLARLGLLYETRKVELQTLVVVGCRLHMQYSSHGSYHAESRD